MNCKVGIPNPKSTNSKSLAACHSPLTPSVFTAVEVWVVVAIVASLILLVAPGCGRGYATAEMQGRVTVDGKPVEDGAITFTPLSGGRGNGATAAIQSGRYQAKDVPQGTVRVTFYAIRKTGRRIYVKEQWVDETVNVIPAKYSAGLTYEVSGQRAQKDFDL